METTLESRAVLKAAEVVGGEEELAARLGLHACTIRVFMSGKLPVPQRVFLPVVDIISGEDLPIEAESPLVGGRDQRADR